MRMISEGVSLLLLSAVGLGLGVSPELRARYPHLKHNLDTDVIIAGAGYDPQTHTVITDDGYILHMHRSVSSRCTFSIICTFLFISQDPRVWAHSVHAARAGGQQRHLGAGWARARGPRLQTRRGRI